MAAKCPAKGKICSNCKKAGHFVRVCRNRTVGEIHQKQTYEANEESGGCDNEIDGLNYTINTIEKVKESSRSWWITLKLIWMNR